MRRLVVALPFGLFAVVVAAFAMGLGNDPRRIPSALLDRQLPAFDLAGLSGDAAGFSDRSLRGRVSLVNFFASWCTACVVEHEMLMELGGNPGIRLVGIDWKDRPGAGSTWLERHGNPYSAIGDDASGRVAIDFGVTGVPETYVVDRSGRVRFKQIGPITEDGWRTVLRPLIERLRSE